MAETFVSRLFAKVRAGFQAISISSPERRRICGELIAYSAEHGCPVFTWLPATGFSLLAGDVDTDYLAELNAACQFDLRATLRAIAGFDRFPAEALFLVQDAHDLLAAPSDDAAITRSLLVDMISGNQFQRGEQYRPIILSFPVASLHPDVAPHLEPLRLPLLTAREISETLVPDIALGLPPGPGSTPEPILQQWLGEATAGLLEHQARNVISECVSRRGCFSHDMLVDVREYRRQLINESGILTVYAGEEMFSDVGGLAALKRLLMGLARSRPPEEVAIARPRGVMLTGVQGCGKSMISRATANETGRIAIELNIDALLGGIVGETEANLRRAIEIIDTSGPCVVLIDEVDKSLSGINNHGASDGGVMSRAFGSLLRWSNDHTSDAILIMTANDVSALPAELTRAERLDAVLHIDLPSAADREVMWKAYIARYRLDAGQRLPRDDDWSGAEIATCTRLAALLGVSLAEAAESVVPVAITHREKIEALRKFADNRFLDAHLGGRYQINRKPAVSAVAPPAAAARPIRKQQRPNTEPGMN